MERTWTVDSIEEGIAAVHEGDGPPVHLPAWLLPKGTREGDVLAVERTETRGSVTLRIRPDRPATERALEASRAQVARMKGDDPGGDIQL
jgi:hypothetical protein